MDSLSVNMATRARSSSAVVGLPFAAEARLLRRYEARVAAAADTYSLISAADRDAPGLEGAAVIQNSVDIEAFPFRDTADREPVMIFFGNLGYFHNIAPAVFVATEVLPLVRQRVPAATVRIVGARPAAAVRQLGALDGVEVAGDVPDMAAELERAAVSVLPVFSGSGLKNKVLEAFAGGLPVVTNALGMQGVEGAAPGREYLAAEGARDIADAAARLLEDPSERRRLASSGRALVEARYSWERQVEALLALYRQHRVEAAARALSVPTLMTLSVLYTSKVTSVRMSGATNERLVGHIAAASLGSPRSPSSSQSADWPRLAPLTTLSPSRAHLIRVAEMSIPRSSRTTSFGS